MRHPKPWSESCERELPSNCELGTRLALAQARAAENLRITWWIWWILWTRIYKTYQNINWLLVLTADIHISQGLWISFLVLSGLETWFRKVSTVIMWYCMICIDVHWFPDLDMFPLHEASFQCRSSRSTVAEGCPSNFLCWLRLLGR